MKNNFSIFTRSTLGIDNQVWLTMLIVCLATILAFGFKAITYVKCTEFEISTTGARQQTNNTFYIGETVRFSTSSILQNRQMWDFGDGTVAQEIKMPVSHSFLKRGKFTVTCTINGKCSEAIIVYITPTPSNPVTAKIDFANPIIGADTIYIGNPGHFSTPIKANYIYQWSVGTSPDIPVQTTAGADFTFYKPGRQTVQLKVDGDKTYTKQVIILSKNIPQRGPSLDHPEQVKIKLPPVVNFIDPSSGGPGTHVTIHGSLFNGMKSVTFGGQPAKIISVSSDKIIAEVSSEGATGAVVVITENGSFPFANPPFTYIAPKPVEPPKEIQQATVERKIGITDVLLKKMLQDVVNNSKHAPDFERYFCSGVNTKVYVNKDKTPITFTQLCEKHLQGKKVEIQSAHIVKDPDNQDCETNLVVKYKKDRFIF